MEGHCLCGLITIRVHDSSLFSPQCRGHLCHCHNCRRVAGGLFGAKIGIEASKVEITGQENLKEYMDKDTTSGVPMARYFCGTCGTPVQSVSPNTPGRVVIKLGVFETVPQPEWEAFAVRRQSWERPLEGCVQYKTLGGPGKEEL